MSLFDAKFPPSNSYLPGERGGMPDKYRRAQEAAQDTELLGGVIKGAIGGAVLKVCMAAFEKWQKLHPIENTIESGGSCGFPKAPPSAPYQSSVDTGMDISGRR
ncbi:MAG: hypothetical protein V4735_04120 [Pseudomonadota bacterium]